MCLTSIVQIYSTHLIKNCLYYLLIDTFNSLFSDVISSYLFRSPDIFFLSLKHNSMILKICKYKCIKIKIVQKEYTNGVVKNLFLDKKKDLLVYVPKR